MAPVISAHAQGTPETEIRQRPATPSADLPLDTIYSIDKYLSDINNGPQVQFASDKTDYAWQQMSRFYNVSMVLRDGPISPLEFKENPAVGTLSFKHPVLGQETVDEHFNKTTMDAMAVIHKGTIIYERYKTMRPFDKHDWFSSGKTIAGTSIALLEDEGKVDISKSMSSYLPELQGSVWDTVTVAETLDMATGLDSNELDTPHARTDPKVGFAGRYRWASLCHRTARNKRRPKSIVR